MVLESTNPACKEPERLKSRCSTVSVEASMAWVSVLMVKGTPGKLCICTGPKPLNWVWKRCQQPLSTIDGILPELSKTRIAMVCDTRHGFWHISLNKESHVLTTFATALDGCASDGHKPSTRGVPAKLTQMLEGMPGLEVTAEHSRIVHEGNKLQKLNESMTENDKLFYSCAGTRTQN